MTNKRENKVEIKPLDNEQVILSYIFIHLQIELSYKIINENHPLSDTPLTEVFSIFKLCGSCMSKKVDENGEPLIDKKEKYDTANYSSVGANKKK